MAAVDFFLKIDSENFDGSYSIQFESWSFGASNPAPVSAASGTANGKVKFNEFTIKKMADKWSPALLRACCVGQQIQEASLSFYKKGTPQNGPPDMSIKLLDCLVSSVQHDGGRHRGSLATETVSLNFLKIKFSEGPAEVDVDLPNNTVDYFLTSQG